MFAVVFFFLLRVLSQWPINSFFPFGLVWVTFTRSLRSCCRYPLFGEKGKALAQLQFASRDFLLGFRYRCDPFHGRTTLWQVSLFPFFY